MNLRAGLICLLGLAAGPAAAEPPAPAVVVPPEGEHWIGQRVGFFIELNAMGSFAGTAGFDLPRMPGVVVLKIGNAVVSSKQVDGDTWFVQRHEFALFSQRDGVLEIPAIGVRFSARDGFTGPAGDVIAETGPWQVEIGRPPGSEGIGYLITTASLEVTEAWDPAPGDAEVGAVFKRTIVQRAPGVSGMALAPAPTAAPDGLRVYPPKSSVEDVTERGILRGERSDTVTYLVERAGTFELPGLTYVWWNPDERELRSRTLPAVQISAPEPPAPVPPPSVLRRRLPWLLLGLGLVAAVVGVWRRKQLAARGRRLAEWLNPPDRVAARRFVRACRQGDAAGAERAWDAWSAARRGRDRSAGEPGQAIPEDLERELALLHRYVYGRGTSGRWDGTRLAAEFRRFVRRSRPRAVAKSPLPNLN